MRLAEHQRALPLHAVRTAHRRPRRTDRGDVGAAGVMWLVTFLLYLLMLAAVPSITDHFPPDEGGLAESDY